MTEILVTIGLVALLVVSSWHQGRIDKRRKEEGRK